MARPRITLSEHLGITPGKRTAFMASLGFRIQSRWRKLSNTALADVSANTRRKYRDAIEVTSYSAESVTVELNDKFASMFEQGLGPGGVGTYGVFDMRKFLLGGGKGGKWPKAGRKGMWRPIPMMRSKGQAMETARQALSQQVMSGHLLEAKLKQIENKLSFMSGTVMGQRNGKSVVVRQGETIPAGRVPVLRDSARSVVAIPGDRSKPITHAQAHPHATDPFTGMIKVQGAYSQKKGGGGPNVQTTGFLTFRVISYGGKPWYHPGIRPRRIAKMVMNQLQDIIPNPMDPAR